jgi:hypothetical protein
MFFSFVFFMQNLSGTTIDMLYESCSVSHQESNKTGFAFFCFFYDFLRIFQVSAKIKTLFKIPLRMQAPGNDPDPAIGSLGTSSGDSGQIPMRGSPERAWKGMGVLRGSPTTDLRLWTARRACWRGSSAAPGGGRRWSSCSGEGSGAGYMLVR